MCACVFAYLALCWLLKESSYRTPLRKAGRRLLGEGGIRFMNVCVLHFTEMNSPSVRRFWWNSSTRWPSAILRWLHGTERFSWASLSVNGHPLQASTNRPFGEWPSTWLTDRPSALESLGESLKMLENEPVCQLNQFQAMRSNRLPLGHLISPSFLNNFSAFPLLINNY